MALSHEFIDFVSRWREKADLIRLRDHDLSSFFDKFFTLFVIYNRLYAEATFTLWREGRIRPSLRNFFPDSTAAKKYVAEFLGAHRIAESLEGNPETRAAIEEMKRILADQYSLVILKGPRAEGCKEDDHALLDRFDSRDAREKAEAVLEFLYTIRCNTFHGSKSYDRVQIPVLTACVTVMSHLNGLLFEKLREGETPVV